MLTWSWPKHAASMRAKWGWCSKLMRNPKFRVDYGMITSLHLARPQWDIPVVGLSANNSPYYLSTEEGFEEMDVLGKATRKGIEETGRRAVCCAGNDEPPSLPGRTRRAGGHVTRASLFDGDVPVGHEADRHDAPREMQKVHEVLPQFVEIAFAEFKAGSFTWMCSAMGYPELPGELHGFGNVIGTGNAVFEWNLVKLGLASPANGRRRQSQTSARRSFVSEPAIADQAELRAGAGPGPRLRLPYHAPCKVGNRAACVRVFGAGVTFTLPESGKSAAVGGDRVRLSGSSPRTERIAARYDPTLFDAMVGSVGRALADP